MTDHTTDSTGPVIEVWTVWPEDEPILGHYTDEVTAKLAAIEFQQDAEGPGHDFVYAWNEHGGHLELLANGDDTGFRVKRDQVQGKSTTAVQADELARLRAIAAAHTALVHDAHDVNDNHLIDAIARANRETADTPHPAVPSATTASDLTPYRCLLARLEADRAGHLRAAGQAADGRLRDVGSSYAAALHHAAVVAVTEFEGAEAAQEYAQQTSGGKAGAGGAVPSAATGLRERVARALREAPAKELRADWTAPGGPQQITARVDDLAAAVLAALKPELDAFADYENRIVWGTTCESCARVLDSSNRERERAEKAEAALGEARETNRRLNHEKQQLESELAAYRRAVSQWEISERSTYVPLHTLAAILKAAGGDVPERWELHYERVERAEADVRRMADEAQQAGEGR